MFRFDKNEKAEARKSKEKVGIIPETGIALQAPEGRQIIAQDVSPG
jgi:hypothetical protein